MRITNPLRYQTTRCLQTNAAMPVAQLSEVLRRSMRRLPSSADGLTDAQAMPNVEGREDKESALMRMVKGFNGQVRTGVCLFMILNPADLPTILPINLYPPIYPISP
jgi:hypothetical protein